MSLQLKPITFRQACEFVTATHRHHSPPRGHKFSVGVANREGELVGVAMAGRPVARMLDDGFTLEVNRTSTDGTRNANSMLYGAIRRAAKALGYRRLVTYTQDGETGASLRGAGWTVTGENAPTQGWARPSRERDDKGTDGIARLRWEAPL